MVRSSRKKALTGLVLFLGLGCLLICEPALGLNAFHKTCRRHSIFRTAPRQGNSPCLPSQDGPFSSDDDSDSADVEFFWLDMTLSRGVLPVRESNRVPVCFPSRHAPAGKPLYLSLCSLVI